MNHTDHVQLLQNGVHATGGVWADIGAGRGAFTLALAELVGPGSTIYAVDRDWWSLRQLQRTLQQRFPDVRLRTVHADFTAPLNLPPLDGIVMANALHFVQDKEPVVRQLRDYLGENGRLLLVEYNTKRGNRWVPHPLTFPAWQRLAARSGFQTTTLLATRPSSFLGEFFAAASLK